MVNNYNEAYKSYYDNVRKKVKGRQSKTYNEVAIKDDIYPRTSNVGDYTYGRGSYQVKSNKKKFKYIDGFIIRLIVTFMLLLGVFTLKTLPNKEAQELYKISKAAINSNFDYTKLLPSEEKIGFDYKDIKKDIEEQCSTLIKKISSINLDDINKALNL